MKEAMANNNHKAKIFALARKLGWGKEELYDFLGIKSLKDISQAEAIQLFQKLESVLEGMDLPNITAGRINGEQRSKINLLRYKLGWHPVHFWRWAIKVIGHDVPPGSDYKRFGWCTEADGIKLIEGLKAICGKAVGV